MGKQLAKIGDKGRQDLGKAATPSNTGTHVARQGIRPHLRKASTPSTTATHVRRQWDTMGDKGRRGKTRGDKTSGRREYHPTKGDKKEDNARQDLGKADIPSNTGTHVGRPRETMGGKGRQDLGYPTQAHMWRGQWETMRHTIHTRAHMWDPPAFRVYLPPLHTFPSNVGTGGGAGGQTRPRNATERGVKKVYTLLFLIEEDMGGTCSAPALKQYLGNPKNVFLWGVICY